ncbi:MAG: oxidoreductase [Planctomycetaceae bacterium]|nr:oxidoreductase [Planctomycetaceae bacterium]
MKTVDSIEVVVTAIEEVTPLIKRFTLRQIAGGGLPPFSGGCHVTVVMRGGERTFRNPYSLLSSPRNLDSYEIAVRRDDQGRGGSLFMHESVTVGTRLEISHPINLFPLSKLARKQILIAGGVGITPILAMIDDLSAGPISWELHYSMRGHEHAFFGNWLTGQHGDRVRLYDTSAGQRIDFATLVARQPLGTHLYVCGPGPMIADALASARAAGWPESHLHVEQFAPPPAGEAFEVHLATSGKTVQVSAEQSLLEALEAAGIEAPYLCRSGACGRCELNVVELDGELLHNDHWLTAEDRLSGTKIMPCVSRSKCRRLVLDW